MAVRNKIYILSVILLFSLLSVRSVALSYEGEGLDTDVDTVATSGDSLRRSAIRSVLPSGRRRHRTDSLELAARTPVMGDTVTTDSLVAAADSVAADSLSKEKKPFLEDIVDFSAQDSMVFMAGNMAYMYGTSVVKYQDIQLDADQIQMSLDSSTVYAMGRLDSLGEIVGSPIYKDASGEYESETMRYNFKSKKGYITNVITQQGEGYLTGGRTKKMEENVLFMENGRYTTCDNHEHPHFYLQLTKAKVRPKQNVVTGPAYMVLEDVPLPLAVPFGFFPFTDKYSSGIIMPTFGDEMTRGFYLRDGGYYFAISDYVDLALTGEIYTKGSWGLRGRSAYVKRYKFSGSVDISYITTITGDKGLPDYSKQNNFRIAWTHTQDAKASTNSSFSASVNFATSGYTRNVRITTLTSLLLRRRVRLSTIPTSSPMRRLASRRPPILPNVHKTLHSTYHCPTLPSL